MFTHMCNGHHPSLNVHHQQKFWKRITFVEFLKCKDGILFALLMYNDNSITYSTHVCKIKLYPIIDTKTNRKSANQCVHHLKQFSSVASGHAYTTLMTLLCLLLLHGFRHTHTINWSFVSSWLDPQFWLYHRRLYQYFYSSQCTIGTS